MYSKETAALVLLGALLSPAVVAAAETLADEVEQDQQSIEEIIVSGQQLSSRGATIIIEREFVIDVAEALSRLPGANRIDGLGVISGGPNSMDAPLSYVSPMITKQLVLERGIPGVASSPESIGGHMDATIARGDFSTAEQFEFGGMAGARYANNGDATSLAGRLTAQPFIYMA